MIDLTWGAVTDPGHKRSRNEDALLASPTLFAVADGMGGHAAGDVASDLAVTTLGQLADTGVFTRTDVLTAVREADAAIVGRAADDQQGMGTTICGLAVVGTLGVDDERFVLFNVGDSRAYRLRGGVLTQLTHDHSVVQVLQDQGSITAEQALRHPERNVITRSLGSGAHLEIDSWVIEPTAGDRYLLASDGLTKELADDAIAERLGRPQAPAAVAQDLMTAALDAGGRDNVTVLVIDVVAAVLSDAGEIDPLDADTNPAAANRFDATTLPPGVR